MLGSHYLHAGTAPAAEASKLSAAEIVERNVAARGGLQAWRHVLTLSMAGKLGAGGDERGTPPVPLPDRRAKQVVATQRLAQEAQLPFVMKLQRPRKVRLEIQFKGKTALQVYDGTTGWKARPYLNRSDIESYTAEELQAAAVQPDLDGPLVDYLAKGTRVELVGVDKVENHDTYKLKLTTKDGKPIHVWIDCQTFLETKIEGQPRRLDGVDRSVEVYYRDFRDVAGLKIPFVLETRVLPAATASQHGRDATTPAERITIENVEVNPRIEASLFTKPSVENASNVH
jgi:outer membrane lipoprotein-sorting protein